MLESFSGNYKILDSNTVFLYDIKGDLEIKVSTGETHWFDLILEFKEDGKERDLKREIRAKEKKVILHCYNFEMTGTGTNSAIELMMANGKTVYMHFWVYRPTKTTRKVEYTLFVER